MAYLRDKWCPECGSMNFDPVEDYGRDNRNLKCERCGHVSSSSSLTGPFPEQTCKNSTCGMKFSSRESFRVPHFVAELKKGFIKCPNCGSRHRAINILIDELTPGTGAYRAAFGELAI